MSVATLALFSVAGCRLRDQKNAAAAQVDPQAAIAAQDAQNAHAKAIAAKEEEQAVALDKDALADKIRMYQALAGDFVARGSAPGGATFESRIHLQADNMPPQSVIDEAIHEPQVQALASDLGISADADDRWAQSDQRIVFCTQSKIQPDFYAGTMRIACAIPSGITRLYRLGFEYDDGELGNLTSESAMLARNRAVAGDLLNGKITSVDAFDLTILGGEVILTGKLRRAPAN